MIRRMLKKTRAKILYGRGFNARGVGGQELDFLMKHIPENKVVMEIGCGFGQNTRRFADKGNMIYAVDPFLPERNLKTLMGENPEYVFNCFIKSIEGRNVLHYDMTSKEALEMYDGIKLDFLFIDGEHTYNALEIDTKWIKHVKKGGLFAFHDCSCEEVNDFLVEHIFPKYKFIGSRFSLFIFRK